MAVGGAEGIQLLRAPDFSEVGVLRLGGWTGRHPVDGIAWRPDGAMLAVEARRVEDDWDSVWITDAKGTVARDVVGDRFPDPGVRTLGTPGWLGPDRVIVFHLDSRSVDYSSVELRTGEFTHACAFTVDGGGRWAEGNRRAFRWGWLGRLAAMELEPGSGLSRCVEIPGCGDGAEYMYAYLDGPTADLPILVARHACGGRQPGRVRIGDPLFVLRDLDADPEPLSVGGAPASWSPDGTRLASLSIVASEARDEPEAPELRLQIVELANRSTQSSEVLGRVPRGFSFYMGTGVLRPEWAPDGRSLVVLTPSRELVQIARDGLRVRQIGRSDRSPGARSFEWSPDSRWLVVRDSPTLYVVETEIGTW